MALFAAQRNYKYYLIVVVLTRIAITAWVYKSCISFTEETQSDKKSDEGEAFIFKSICILSSVFNLLPIGCERFLTWYVLYWASIMVENGALAFIWYDTCIDSGDMTSAWYRRPVLIYLVLAYIVSVVTLPVICLCFQTFKDYKEETDSEESSRPLKPNPKQSGREYHDKGGIVIRVFPSYRK